MGEAEAGLLAGLLCLLIVKHAQTQADVHRHTPPLTHTGTHSLLHTLPLTHTHTHTHTQNRAAELAGVQVSRLVNSPIAGEFFFEDRSGAYLQTAQRI